MEHGFIPKDLKPLGIRKTRVLLALETISALTTWNSKKVNCNENTISIWHKDRTSPLSECQAKVENLLRMWAFERRNEEATWKVVKCLVLLIQEVLRLSRKWIASSVRLWRCLRVYESYIQRQELSKDQRLRSLTSERTIKV